MTTTDLVFQRALSNMLTEIFDGPPGQEAYLLNPATSQFGFRLLKPSPRIYQ